MLSINFIVINKYFYNYYKKKNPQWVEGGLSPQEHVMPFAENLSAVPSTQSRQLTPPTAPVLGGFQHPLLASTGTALT